MKESNAKAESIIISQFQFTQIPSHKVGSKNAFAVFNKSIFL